MFSKKIWAIFVMKQNLKSSAMFLFSFLLFFFDVIEVRSGNPEKEKTVKTISRGAQTIHVKVLRSDRQATGTIHVGMSNSRNTF